MLLRRTTEPLDGGALGEIAPDDASTRPRLPPLLRQPQMQLPPLQLGSQAASAARRHMPSHAAANGPAAAEKGSRIRGDGRRVGRPPR